MTDILHTAERFDDAPFWPDDLTIDDFCYFYTDHDPIFCDERALAYLLWHEHCFMNTRPYISNPWGELKEQWTGDDIEGPTVVVFVNCNDVFAWACADAECIPKFYDGGAGDTKPIYHLLRLTLEYRHWGAAIWCCLQRQQKPQKPVEEDMRKRGEWPPEMDALPDNTQDAQVHAQIAYVAAKMQQEKMADGSDDDS